MAAEKQDPTGSGEELLTAVVSESWGRPVRTASWEAEEVDCPFDSPATAGLFRVRGTTREDQPWSRFATVLQHPRHWVGIDQAPSALREGFEADSPGRGEPVAWEPAFVTALPPGLRVPVLHRVVDLGEDRLVLRMEDVDIDPGLRDPPRFARGLAEGGAAVPAAEVVPGHHGSLPAWPGFTVFPLEHLGDPPTPALEELFAQRAALTRDIADSAPALEH